MFATSRTISDRVIPLTIDDGPKAAIPGGENNAVTECAEIEVASRAGVENSVIGQHQRDRRIELPESAQHPVLPHRLVVARDPHHREQFFGDVDLPAAVHALIFAMADDVAPRLGERVGLGGGRSAGKRSYGPGRGRW